jgi:hypothetical protein
MSEDQAAKEAKQLIDQFGGIFSDLATDEDVNEFKDSIAALLRARDERIAAYAEQYDLLAKQGREMEKQLAAAQAEIKRLEQLCGDYSSLVAEAEGQAKEAQAEIKGAQIAGMEAVCGILEARSRDYQELEQRNDDRHIPEGQLRAEVERCIAAVRSAIEKAKR